MSANNYLFSGSIVAIVTPMDSSGEIDFVRLKSLVEH
ncbi:dihydrodipicolinate synthase, partial [Pasteurella multocida subsp. multocida str. Anand1_buffalo]